MAAWRLMNAAINHSAFLTVRFLFLLFATCWRYLNGTAARVKQRFKPENYAWSAHVQNVAYRHKFDLFAPVRLDNFILTHNGFEHPETVLRDGVTLCNVTENEAIFVESADGVDVTKVKTMGLVAVGQFLHGKRIITLPLPSFHKLAEKLGPPSGELVVLWNTGSCGSTLLTEFFDATGECVCYSEPDLISTITLWMDSLPEIILEQRIVSCIRLLFKPRNGKSQKANILKPRGLSIKMAQLFTDTYPRARNIFVYRDCVPVARLLARSSEYSFTLRLCLTSPNVSRILASRLINGLAMPFDNPEFLEKGSLISKAALMWVLCCHYYLQHRWSGVNFAGFRYDDFIADPLRNVQLLLKYLDLPTDWAERGLHELNIHNELQPTQLLINKTSVTGIAAAPDFSAKDLLWIDRLCKRYLVPSITKKCLLENTLTAH